MARNLVKEIRGGDSVVGGGGGGGNSNCGNIQSRCGQKWTRAAPFSVLRRHNKFISLEPVSFLTSLKKCVECVYGCAWTRQYPQV